MRLPALLAASIALLALAGCESPAVVPMDGDTYLVAKRSAQIGSGPPVQAEADVYAVANAFCAGRGKALETVSLEMNDAALTRPASVTLVFRCVDPAKPSAASRRDAEKQLEQLKSMQARGLITQEDFDRKKKEILARM